MLIQGYQRKSVIQYCAEKYDIEERQADEYIRKARDIMHSDMQISVEIKKSEILTQYYDLYNKSYKIEDYRECRNVLKEISDIFGVEAAKKIESISTINVIDLGSGKNPIDEIIT